MAQCLTALSAVNVLLSSLQDSKRLRRAAGSASAYDLSIVALASALLVAALCALQAAGGIVRSIRGAAARSGDDGTVNGGNLTAGAGPSAGSAKGGTGGSREQALRGRGGMYRGSCNKARIYEDVVLFVSIGLVVLGLVLTRPTKHGHAVPLCLMVELGLLFSYKPLRALRAMHEEFVGQLALLRVLVCTLWPRHGLKHRGQSRQGRPGSAGGDGHEQGCESDFQDMFDEHDLSAATHPAALAAEVIRLRRKVAALEEKLEPTAGHGVDRGQG